MRINIDNKSSTQFRGYNNVISNICKEPAQKDCFGYIAMQLDNIGKKDLEIWHKIQKDFMKRNVLKDTITFSYFTYDGKTDFLISNYLLSFPEEEKSTELEKIKLKTLTLIASLTKRIKCKIPFSYNNNFNKTLLEAKDDLMEIYNGNEDFVKEFMLQGIRPNATQQEPAEEINNIIQENMEKYFEIKSKDF